MNQNANTEATLAVGALGAVIAAVVAAWGAVWATYATAAGSQRPPANPFALSFYLAEGRYQWTGTATLWAVAEGIVIVALVVLVARSARRSKAGASHIDRRARRLAMDRKGLRRYTDRSFAPVAAEIGPGPQIGRIVRG